MPIDYQKGKIYKIVDNTTDNIYIGSTCEPTLARRLAKHVASYKSHLNKNYHYISSFDILKNGDYDIILIENFPCNTKDDLFARERYWTNEHIFCVNKCRNQGLIKEIGQKEYSKDYYENNRDKINEKHKIYRDNNKDYFQKYYESNKDKIHMQQNKKCNCFCGGKYTQTNKIPHFLTKKHQEYEKQNQIPLDV